MLIEASTRVMRTMMKGRGTRRRRSVRGFTLIELMVVVMLVALLAALAVPSMATARNDRVAFDYARQTSELFHNARARATGRGAAHLVFFTSTDPGSRGAVFVFEGLDGTGGASDPNPNAGPNPSSACRDSGQWGEAATWAPGSARLTPNRRASLVDWLNINVTAGNTATVIEDITMTGFTVNATTGAKTPVGTIAMCTTPNGTTWVGTGPTRTDAVADLLNQKEPFKQVVEIDVARNRSGTAVGLTRRVILAGAGAPRIRSQ